MKSNQIINIILSIVVLSTISSCFTAVTPKVVNKVIPDNFLDQITEDSISSSDMHWNDFFSDPLLIALIDSALVNNQELNIMLQKIAIAQNEVMVREGEYRPMANGILDVESEKAAKYTRNGAIEENVLFSTENEFPAILNNLHIGLQASWELDVWHKLRNARQVAYLEYLATEEGRNFVVTGLISEIASKYYELVALDNQLDNINQNLALQENALEKVKVLQQAGRESTLAVRRFEAEVEGIKSELFLKKQEIVVVENEINFLVGRAPQAIERNTANFTTYTPQVVQLGLPAEMLSNRPDIRQREMELQAAALDVEVARANFYPEFTLRAGIGIEAFNPKFILNPESIIANLVGDAVAPLINRRAIKAEYANASLTQIQSVYEYEMTVLNAYFEVVNQFSKVNNMEEAFIHKKMQVAAMDQSIEVANQLFQSARADYLEVLLAQREALESKLELIETKKEQMVAMVDLYRALGGGWK